MTSARVWSVPARSALCAPGCAHKACAAWLRVAACPCRICRRAIGFDVAIVVDPRPLLGETEERPVHRACEERERHGRRAPPQPTWQERQRVGRAIADGLRAGGAQARALAAWSPNDDEPPRAA
jgi:hypothetical protein